MAEKFLILLSPAKNLADRLVSKQKSTQPLFKNEIGIIIDTLKKYSMGDISKLMKLSTKLAKLNYDRYQAFDPTYYNKENASQALLTFNGHAYEALDANSLGENDLNYLKSHLYILSGLYGLLRTTDLMQPYRLEMGTALKVNDANNLYQFWQDKLTESLNKIIKKEGFTHILNCASNEYATAINFKALSIPTITCQFKVCKNNQYKTIGIYAKKARGLMVRYLAENNVTSLKGLKGFNSDGYTFAKEDSDNNTFIYTRKI